MAEHLTEVGVGAAVGILASGSRDTVYHGGEGMVECHLHGDKRLQCGFLIAWSARKRRARAGPGASLESSSLTSVFLCLPNYAPCPMFYNISNQIHQPGGVISQLKPL